MIIDCRNIVKSFGKLKAVNDVSFSVQAGECFGLLGPNGAGKSTLINTLYGACSRDSGVMQVFDKDPMKDSRTIKRDIGVVTQENCLDEAMSVIENMRLFASFVGVPRAQREERVRSLLSFMSLSHKANERIKTLSGGMQRRLVFVRALLGTPKLIILDEPTTGLDPAVRHLIWDKVNELKQKGTTILLTTHYMEEAERLCDRLLIMDQGKVVGMGAPNEFIKKHCPGYMANFKQDGDARTKAKAFALEHADIHYFEDVAGFSLRAPSMERLAHIADQMNIEPALIRPTNLEDVFLHVTGKELSVDA